MTCRMYTKISKFLHISSREDKAPCGHDEYDKLAKVRWFVDHLNQKFEQVYHVEFSGRCSFVQFNSVKLVKRGVKLFMACSAESAFCYKFMVYLGKSSCKPSKNGFYFDIIWDLVKRLKGHYHHIYFDNLYTSVPIMKFLFSKGLYSVGTLCKGRKLLPQIIKNPPAKLAQGNSLTVQSTHLSNLTATVWSDTKYVSFLSTASQPHIISKTHRTVGCRHIEVTIPAVVKQYGQFYSGVDHLDHVTSKRIYGEVSHSSQKVWKHLYFDFINWVCAQCWILYQKTSTRSQPKNYDHLQFRLELAKGLIGNYSSRQRTAPRQNNSVVLDNVSGHQLVRMNSKRPKRCAGHSKFKPNNKVRKESVYGCHQCGQHYCSDCFWLAHCNL